MLNRNFFKIQDQYVIYPFMLMDIFIFKIIFYYIFLKKF